MIAAIYARKSTEQHGADADAKSVGRQIENARAFAMAKGWRVSEAHVYADDAVSGAETRKLVNRQRLLGVIAAGPPFQVLIVRDASRFSRRDGDEAFGELKRIAHAGVAIWFYQDGTRFTFGTFGENVVGFVRAEMNAEFRRSIGKWVSEAMLRKAKAGYVTGGRVFGYDNIRVDGHVERRINGDEADIVRRIFALCAAGTGYGRIAKQLNAEGAPCPRRRAQSPRAGWTSTSIFDVLHRPLYRGEIVWNRTRKRDEHGATAATPRPESEWLRVEQADLRLVSEDVWRAAHRRIDGTRAGRNSRSDREPVFRRRDQDSAYLLSGFGRCALCGGGLHVRQREHGQRQTYTYACTSHYNKGPQVCPHVHRWPMEALDREVLAAIVGDTLKPDLVEEIVAAAREMFDAAEKDPSSARTLEQQIETLKREQTRLADAIAAGADVPIVVDRLRVTEAKRRDLVAQLETRRKPAQRAPWREIERRVRQSLTDWRALLSGDVAQARDGFRQLLTTPIVFTPFEEPDRRGLRFEGRIGLTALLGGALVTTLSSPSGTSLDYQPVFRGEFTIRRRAA